MDLKTKWRISGLFTLACGLAMIALWTKMDSYSPHVIYAESDPFVSAQLVSLQSVEQHLQKYWEPLRPPEVSTIRIPTGIFVQSLKFVSASEVNITGYIWQRYADGLDPAIVPGEGQAGFILPEQVDTGAEPVEAYRYTDPDNNDLTIGWYFESTLKQQFEYDIYPFDHKTVWVRLWSKDFSKNIVLVPDLQAYKKTGTNDVFGIEESIVLGTWERKDTFFNYRSYSYTTNFGVPYIGLEGFPELHYNMVINRRVQNALVTHLLPISLVAALLFGALLTFSRDPDLSNRHGFNTTGVIAACSALFFVVMIAHIQLREQFSGSGIVYMEYFYFVMYIMLVTVSVFAYVFAKQDTHQFGSLNAKDGVAFKLAYWPILLGSMTLITLFVVWLE